MGYRLDLSTPIPAALRAVAAEQLEDAADGLRDDGGDSEGAVHNARKDLKKTRSLLRLARPGMPAKTYRAENARLREAARAISGTRDADVMVATADLLAKTFAGRLPEATFHALREPLAAGAAEARRGKGSGGGPEQIIPALEAALARVSSWSVDACDHDTLVAGARRAYERGLATLEAAERDPSAENLHEWRKRVKDLWYHLRLLRDLHPVVLEAEVRAAHALADLLGDDHDLATLRPLVGDGAVIELLNERSQALQAEAFALGHRIYARRPKDFARWLGRLMRLTSHPAAAAP